jgi:hypothetical protein
MKFMETEFARQLLGVVLGTLVLVASVAFVSIPTSLGCSPAYTDECAASALERHLT